ncbi:MAG TPA: class I SAM-dependent methyltransferase [Gammaproteobacteria bacterium]
METRGYQFAFSSRDGVVQDAPARERKARTMLAVLGDRFGDRLQGMRLLDLGSSTGIIGSLLADRVAEVVGLDIDAPAIERAQRHLAKDNLRFRVGDAMSLDAGDGAFDIVVCAHVYEHVPDAATMMNEIYRVLKPGGVCYFAAANRLMWMEPHYQLPLLSVLPRRLAHLYIRAAGKAEHYHELHLGYWGLKRLVRRFRVHDYTRLIVAEPDRFHAEYMLTPGSVKTRIARFVARHVYWLMPTYIWLLEKPA